MAAGGAFAYVTIDSQIVVWYTGYRGRIIGDTPVTKESVIEKMRGLRAKMSSASSTEAEVETAARFLAKLSVQHDIDESEIDLEDGVKEKGIIAGWKWPGKQTPDIIKFVWVEIEKFTETKCWLDAHDGIMRFAGRAVDVEMAVYLISVIHESHKRGWFKFSAPHMGAGQKELNKMRVGFMNGFGNGVAKRLSAVVEEKFKARAAAMGDAVSTALVVTKSAIAQEAMEEAGIGELGKSKSKKVNVEADFAAFIHGIEAAKTISINRPLEHKS